MNFTCTGDIVKWRAAGEFENGTKNVKIVIWSLRDENTYERGDEIELGKCENETQALAVPRPELESVYECTLPKSKRIRVHPGDIIGTEIPGSQHHFRLYFDNLNTMGPPNYRHVTFDTDPPTIEITLDSSLSIIPQDLPLIALVVEQGTCTATVSMHSTLDSIYLSLLLQNRQHQL